VSDWGDDYDEDGIEAVPIDVDEETGEVTGDVDESAAPETPPLYYGSVDEFVRKHLRYVYRRRIAGDGRSRVWAAEWWRYAEAVSRLDSLWRAWEHLRLDASTGMSVWWRDHADHHMPILLDPDGPFAGAEGELNSSKRGEPLPYAPPPEGLFPDVRETAGTD